MSGRVCKCFERFDAGRRMQIGSGNYSLVYKTKTNLGAPFAVKRALSTKENPRIEQGWNALSQLRSKENPHIIRPYKLRMSQSGIVELAMELLEGLDTRGILKLKGPIPEDQTLEIIAQIVTGLQTVHELDLIHRDIRPDNIFITKSGRVVLLDFDHTFQKGRDLNVWGDPEYKPPEIFFYDPSDSYSDIFSLGLTIYEILTNSLPNRRYANEISPDDIKIRGISTGMETILKRTLAFEPEDRYQTCGELLTAIRAAQTESGPQLLQSLVE